MKPWNIIAYTNRPQGTDPRTTTYPQLCFTSYNYEEFARHCWAGKNTQICVSIFSKFTPKSLLVTDVRGHHKSQPVLHTLHYSDIIMSAIAISNHRRLDCLLNRLFRHRSKKTSKLRDAGLCEGIPSVNCPLWGESSGDRWFFPHKEPVTQKMFLFDGVIMAENILITFTAIERGSNTNLIGNIYAYLCKIIIPMQLSTKTLGSTSITVSSDRCLINVDPWVFTKMKTDRYSSPYWEML